jgi:predicted HicB family RNase H-like nuclease
MLRLTRMSFGYTILGMVKKTAAPRRHTAMLNIRLLPEHAELIRQAAEHAGVSLSDWIRERLIRAARKEVPEKLPPAQVW